MCECVCVFVLKCLCLSLMRRSGTAERRRPPFLPTHTRTHARTNSRTPAHKQKKRDVARKSKKRNKKREKTGASESATGPCVSNSTLRVPGVLYQSPPTPSSPGFPLLCGCNQKGQIKGGGRVSLQRFSSQSCQSVAECGALGGS